MKTAKPLHASKSWTLHCRDHKFINTRFMCPAPFGTFLAPFLCPAPFRHLFRHLFGTFWAAFGQPTHRVDGGLDRSIGESPQLHIADHAFPKLVHDALLSRRRSHPVDLSKEVPHPTPLRYHQEGTNQDNPIRRRRIEFNKRMQRTIGHASKAACPTAADPQRR